jgi:hypothetical protein
VAPKPKPKPHHKPVHHSPDISTNTAKQKMPPVCPVGKPTTGSCAVQGSG